MRNGFGAAVAGIGAIGNAEGIMPGAGPPGAGLGVITGCCHAGFGGVLIGVALAMYGGGADMAGAGGGEPKSTALKGSAAPVAI